MPRILIADDHGLYRKGLRASLEAALPDLEVSEAHCLDQALMILEVGDRFDVVLLDLYMPGVVSFDSLRAARDCYANIRFMVISASDSRRDLIGCLSAGLHGFVSKFQTDLEIVDAIQQVLNGAIYVPPWLARIDPLGGVRLESDDLTIETPLEKLTPRQRDVLPLLAKGMSNKEIARELRIAEATTKIHAAALARVLGARNRAEAALSARLLLTGTFSQGSAALHPNKK